MEVGSFLQQASVYLLAAVVSVPIARRTGLGSVLGYLLAGVAIGPSALGLVGEERTDVMHFAEFGVVMMLFLIGLELRPSKLWRLRGPILGLGGLQVGVTAAVICGVALAVGRPLHEAVAIGMILALSSTAIVLQSLAEKGTLDAPAGRSAFSVLLFQDIAVIPMLAILPLLAVGDDALGATAGAGDGHGDGHGAAHAADPLVVVGVIAAVVIGGRYLARPVFRFVAAARLPEVFTATALLLVFGISWVMTEVGLSPALGTFLAGVVLADSEYRHELEADVEPFKGLLLGLFFLAVGAGIDFELLAEAPGTIAGLVVGLVAIKLAVLAGLGAVFRMPLAQTALFAIALAQGGEFAFVLFAFASQSGVLGDAVTAPLIAAVALSMALTPLLLMAEEKLLRPRLARLGASEELPAGPDGSHDAPVIIAGFGRFGHVVGRLLRAHGFESTVLELDPNQIRMLEKFGFRAWYGDASRADLLEAAGAARAKLLVVAVDDEEKSLEIVDAARRHFPHLRLLVRARGRRHAYELLDRDVDEIFRETLGASLDLGERALTALGFRAYEAHRAARLFHRLDERSVRELAADRSDMNRYVGLARQRIQALERILTTDRERFADSGDPGWDPPRSDPRATEDGTDTGDPPR